MNWFRHHGFVRLYLGLLGLTTVVALTFVFHERAGMKRAEVRLQGSLKELNRLHRTTPLPNTENFRRMRMQLESNHAAIAALEQKLQARSYPILPLLPNEFQSQLRLAIDQVLEHAADAKVRLPVNFKLGFDRYSTSLPDAEAAPKLGQELRGIEWLVNTLITARIDAITSLTRAPLADENVAPSSSTKGAPRNLLPVKQKPVVSATVELAFSGRSSAVRRVVNEVSAAKEQFYIIRTLVVKSQAEQGPKRSQTGSMLARQWIASSDSSRGAAIARPALTFIVGTEHLDVISRVDIVRFQLSKIEN